MTMVEIGRAKITMLLWFNRKINRPSSSKLSRNTLGDNALENDEVIEEFSPDAVHIAEGVVGNIR